MVELNNTRNIQKMKAESQRNITKLNLVIQEEEQKFKQKINRFDGELLVLVQL